jgi:hypothetical protein
MAELEKLARAWELDFESPLDEGIRGIVFTPIAHGVEKCESCQSGDGYAYHDPTVRFEGDLFEGLRAVAVAIVYGFPVSRLQSVWSINQNMLHGYYWWEMTFISPRPVGSVANEPNG